MPFATAAASAAARPSGSRPLVKRKVWFSVCGTASHANTPCHTSSTRGLLAAGCRQWDAAHKRSGVGVHGWMQQHGRHGRR